jgi:hypothetical protein
MLDTILDTSDALAGLDLEPVRRVAEAGLLEWRSFRAAPGRSAF